MKFFKIVLFFFICQGIAVAQGKHDYMWMIGEGNLSGDVYPVGVEFNFNDQKLDIDVFFRPTDMYLTNASICDEKGNLLFYTNGCFIVDASHEMMMNGDSLNPTLYSDLRCRGDFPSGSVPQSMIILPHPHEDSSHLYYVIHQLVELGTQPVNFFLSTLLYTQVDMTKNGGLGAVTGKRQVIYQDSAKLHLSQLTAVKHENGKDWWILFSERKSNTYLRTHLSGTGFSVVEKQDIGFPVSREGEGGGQAVFSPDGQKYVRYTPKDGAYIYDFDRSTGLLSNFEQVLIQDTLGSSSGGIAISPNSQYLYVSNVRNLYQLDLSADDIAGSLLHIAAYDGSLTPFPANFYLMQLGPDCKIYMISTNGVYTMHIIHQPDERGAACQFEQNGINIWLATGERVGTGISIPNFPNYRLGVGPPCDPDIATSVRVVPGKRQELNIEIYPNPTTGQFFISFNNQDKKDKLTLSITDVTGKIVYFEQIMPTYAGRNNLLVGDHSLLSGLYFVTLSNSHNTQTAKIYIL
ncbi:MAG: T9SS type A sorting domain-containing protein [Bacteroidota bacterium]